MTRPTALVILDGWGIRDERRGNAIRRAKTPNIDALYEHWPHTTLVASGEAVGLPDGQQGNSEVGHLTIGAGRVIYQPLTRISKSIEDGSFYENPVLVNAMDRGRAGETTVHCIGLISPGGVHSHTRHAIALAELAKRRGFERLAFHCFLDGRDTPPTSGLEEILAFQDALEDIGVGRIASLGGRYFAMDRDRRWGRIEEAYNVLVGKEGGCVSDIEEYVSNNYDDSVTDEFIHPVSIAPTVSERTVIRPGDVIICFNFRPDRMRQLIHAFIDPDFSKFYRGDRIEPLEIVTFATYDEQFHLPVAFPAAEIHNTLGEIVSAHHLSQFHVAETEKYAHVTYFINGGHEQPFHGEDRLLVPSPKVPTYDRFPEMSAFPITNAVVDRIEKHDDALIVVNYANADMVGHTGDLKATVVAVEEIDTCVGRIIKALGAKGGTLVLTADHGNAEVMIDPESNAPRTSHTTSPVPLVVAGMKNITLRSDGALADVAPTCLDAMGLPIPSEMTGHSMIVRAQPSPSPVHS